MFNCSSLAICVVQQSLGGFKTLNNYVFKPRFPIGLTSEIVKFKSLGVKPRSMHIKEVLLFVTIWVLFHLRNWGRFYSSISSPNPLINHSDFFYTPITLLTFFLTQYVMSWIIFVPSCLILVITVRLLLLVFSLYWWCIEIQSFFEKLFLSPFLNSYYYYYWLIFRTTRIVFSAKFDMYFFLSYIYASYFALDHIFISIFISICTCAL